MKCECCGKPVLGQVWGHWVCAECHGDWHRRAPTAVDVEAKYGRGVVGLSTGYEKFTGGWLDKRKAELKP